MNKDHVLGVAKTIAGHVKEATGRVLGDPKAIAEGKALKLAGKAQSAVGTTRDAIRIRFGR